jgi:futalosine hydrolase
LSTLLSIKREKIICFKKTNAMRILIVAATWLEAKPLMSDLWFLRKFSGNLYSFRYTEHRVDVLVTGVGMLATTYGVTKALDKTKYALVINVGICGSFSAEFEPGSVVNVHEECQPEFGITDSTGFTPILDVGFDTSLPDHFKETVVSNPHHNQIIGFKHLPYARGATVNHMDLTGKSHTSLMAKLNPQVETMEGIGFFYPCMARGIPFIQIRAVSNYVGIEDKSEWAIELAIENLKRTVYEAMVAMPK